VGLLELADRPADRAGERALLVPEQLALDQLAGNCRGVDGNEGPVLARAELVDRFRDELLAGARFTEDQYREVVTQDPGDHPVDVLHRLAAPDQRQPLPYILPVGLAAPARIGRLARGADEFV